MLYKTDEYGFVKLRSENKGSFYDLEVKVAERDNVILVKTDFEDKYGIKLLGFTIEEIETLYNFAQIVKLNSK